MFIQIVCVCVCALSLTRVWLFETPWAVPRQAPLSMGFSRQECWSGLPCPPPGDLPDPGIEPVSPESASLASGFFTTVPPSQTKLGSPQFSLLLMRQQLETYFLILHSSSAREYDKFIKWTVYSRNVYWVPTLCPALFFTINAQHKIEIFCFLAAYILLRGVWQWAN